MTTRCYPSRRRFLLTTLAVPLATQAMLGAQTKKPMRIAFIGSGRQGGALGLQLAKAGHEVMFSSRNPDQLKDLVATAGVKARAGRPDEAAKFGDVIVVAVPYGALPLGMGLLALQCLVEILALLGGRRQPFGETP